MSDTPTKPHSYPSFEDPPPRAISIDALLGRVIRRMFEDGAHRRDGLAGTLQVVLASLDQGATTISKPSR